jgi:glycosyltransferase involved in cell wall biosynthesis
VRLLGPFDERDLARLYATCACVVVPSRSEGFGIPALEARRARAPLCIADIPALVEVAGPAAPRFPPDDPAACAAAIRRALATPTAELQRAGRRADRRTWGRSARAWHALWQRAAVPLPG